MRPWVMWAPQLLMLLSGCPMYVAGLQHETKASLAADSAASSGREAAVAAAGRAAEARAVEAAAAEDELLAQRAARDAALKDSLRLLQDRGDEEGPEGEGSQVPGQDAEAPEDTARAMMAKWADEEHKGKIIQKMTTATTTEPIEVRAERRWQQKLDTLLSVKTFLYQDGGIVGNLARQLAVPVAALGLGLVLWCALPKQSMVPHLVMFFGAQSFVNIYMKAMFSDVIIDAELKMRGFQGPLIMTALQQLVTFLCLWTLVGLSQLTPWKYRPRPLTKASEVMTVLCHAVFFSANIALNNFSLSMLDISVNLIIRSVAPLTTLIVQVAFTRCLGSKSLEPVEIGLMLIGALCGLIAVIAKGHGLTNAADSSHLIWGGCICLFSLFSAGMELVLAGLLGSGLGLNPIDTTFYMAVPVALLLSVPIFFVQHPVAWAGHGLMTDFQILKEVIALSPGTFGLALFSGAFAMVYNILLYNIVQTLSPAFSAFTSNFNKAATIALSVLLGFEVLPKAPWGMVQVFGIIGNMVAFTVYGLYKVRPRGDKK
mmetsp:Transcript_10212/g.28719  ORF Transcript_10212/g.28719 Transcript_10212/m.28719 type:complete len:542 (-) Transcript_10212:192-1817(-)